MSDRIHSDSIHLDRNTALNIIMYNTDNDILRKQAGDTLIHDSYNRFKKAVLHSGIPCLNGCYDDCTSNGPHGPNHQHKVAIWVNMRHMKNYCLYKDEFIKQIKYIEKILSELDNNIHEITPYRWCGNPHCNICIIREVSMEKKWVRAVI